MIEKFGGIIKLNRLQEGLTLKYIKYKTNISKGQLSRIENNKERVSIENIKEIFDAMEILFTENDLNQQFEIDFKIFYLDVAYLRDFRVSFDKIKSYQKYIRSSFSYVKYLLACMIYETMISPKDIHKKYAFIENYFQYLESYQIQLYYDYLGAYYYCQEHYQKALDYYDIALRYKGTLYSESMLYFHIGTSQAFIGDIRQALRNSEKARDMFAKINNLKRLVSANFDIARVYSRNGDFEESEKINLSCIEAFKELELPLYVAKTYNNLLWGYVRAHKYEKVFEYSAKALETNMYTHCIYFYMAYSAYYLGHAEQASEYIKFAKNSLDNSTKYMKVMINAFYFYLSKVSDERKEKHLLKVYESAKRTNDSDLKVFTLELLVEFYEKCNNQLKQLDYIKDLIYYYKN